MDPNFCPTEIRGLTDFHKLTHPWAENEDRRTSLHGPSLDICSLISSTLARKVQIMLVLH